MRSARILVVSRSSFALADLCAGLNQAGFDAVLADDFESNPQAFDFEAVILDLGGGKMEQGRLAADALRRSGESRPVVAALLPQDAPAAPEGAFDLILRRPWHPGQISARMQEAMRLAAQQAEARLRKQTLAELGVPLPPELDRAAQRPSVLFVGAADPAYMHVRSALEAGGADVVAAFTSFTAFDYLHDRLFHAVVLGCLEKTEPAFTICSAMRRNARLMHVPALILVDPARFGEIDEAYARGASDILSADAPAEETRERIMVLAAERQRGLALRDAFDLIRDPALLDRATGLFKRDVFLSHLRRMTAWAEETGKPLSLVVIRAQPSVFSDPPTPGALADARIQFGGMFRHLVRTEDFPARLDEGIYVAAMPATDLAEAKAAAERIRSAADCAAFGGDLEDGGFRLALHAACAQLGPGEMATYFLKRAVEGLSAPAQRDQARGQDEIAS